MKNIRNQLLISLLIFAASLIILSFARPGEEFLIYQFPREKTPSIDGDFSEWEMVPDSFYIGSDQLINTVFNEDVPQDPADYDLKVKVGWVNGLNRLYFYLEAYDDYWDFKDPGLYQDIFELVVDADLSGGNFINSSNLNKNKLSANELHFKGHGGHAQNYHIFTPVKDKEGALYFSLGTGSSGDGIRSIVRGKFDPRGRPGRMHSSIPYRGCVMKLTKDGKTIPWSYGHRTPNGLGFDLEGNFLRLFGGMVIKKYFPPGYEWEGYFVRIQSLAFDDSGQIHALDCYLDKVQILDPDTGAYLSSYGESGTAPGQLDLPTDIAIDDLGRTVVSDGRNQKVEIIYTTP